MADKEQLRKQRNREAAQRSYFRRKAEKEELEKKLEKSEKRQISLNREIRMLKSQVAAYETVWENIHHVCNRYGGPGSSTGSSDPSSSSDAFNHASTSGSAPSFDATQAESTGPSPTQSYQTTSDSTLSFDVQEAGPTGQPPIQLYQTTSGSAVSFDIQQVGSLGPFPTQSHQATSGSAPSYSVTQVGSTGPTQFPQTGPQDNDAFHTESKLHTTPQSAVSIFVPTLSHPGACPPVSTVTSQNTEQVLCQQRNVAEYMTSVQPASLTSQQCGSSFSAAGGQDIKALHLLSASLPPRHIVSADISALQVSSRSECKGASTADGSHLHNVPSSDLFDLLTDFNIHHGPSLTSTIDPVKTSFDKRHNNAFTVADEFIKNTAMVTVTQTYSAEGHFLQPTPEVSNPTQEDILTISLPQRDPQTNMSREGLPKPTPCTDPATIGWMSEMSRTPRQKGTSAKAVSDLSVGKCSNYSPLLSPNSFVTGTTGSSSGFNKGKPNGQCLDRQQGGILSDVRNYHKAESFKRMATETAVSQTPKRTNIADLNGICSKSPVEMTPLSMTKTETNLKGFLHEDYGSSLTEVPKFPGSVSNFHNDNTCTSSGDTLSDTVTENCGTGLPAEMFRRNMDNKTRDMTDITSAYRLADVNVKLKKKYK